MIDLLAYEKELYEEGIEYIAGTDEAGRGPLAGPVVAAAVILPKNMIITGVNDSKQHLGHYYHPMYIDGNSRSYQIMMCCQFHFLRSQAPGQLVLKGEQIVQNLISSSEGI